MTHIKDYTGRRAHLIGIGGSSMSGLAGMLVGLGVRVTGSDSARSYTTDALEQSGIHVFIGQRAENVDGADIVIYSAAIAKSNPERMRAEELGIPQMERATLLGQLMEGYRHAVNVCGTHGKTTTTSMIAEAMLDTGFDPTVHIGGSLDFIGGSVKRAPKWMSDHGLEWLHRFMQNPMRLYKRYFVEDRRIFGYYKAFKKKEKAAGRL